MRFELAMVLPKDRKTAAAIALGSTGIALVASAFAESMLWIFGPWILEGNAEGSFGLLSLLLSLGILSGAIFTPEAMFCPAPTRIRGAAIKITLAFRPYPKSSNL
jgi:hypothetical protein